MTDTTSERTAVSRAARHRGRRRGRAGLRAAMAVVPLALLASGAMVYQASNAAFTATTATGANSWTAGTVTLTNSASGSLLFNVTGIKPGAAAASTQYQCVTVSYTGSLAPDIRFYLPGTGTGAVTDVVAGQNAHNLSAYLRVKIEQSSNTTATNAACNNFAGSGTYVNPNGANGDTLASLASGASDWSSGLGSWTPGAGNVSQKDRIYKVSYWLPDVGETGMNTGNATQQQNTLNDLQGTQVTAALTWEARNL